ncbi:lipopolysaccharide biosynthesis protein [Allorhizocola rhizosphaerae]|uniref:lipopolysaccharide biosynthesis protein n=1 Tax=Allorhizocola rhizosphaerae TaxID=1872709 RepID=UPI000E3B5EBA|nr:MATE family efflux transporter [Allorhizocola rhizosphaerae]
MTKVDLAAPPPSALVGAARGGLGNLAGAAVAGIAGVAVTWLVARVLGPAAAGSFFAATSAFVLAGSVARLGTTTALVYWPARLRAQGRPELIGACLRAGLVPVLVLSTALAVGLWFGAPAFFPDFAGPLRTLALFLPVAALADALLAATRGYRLMLPTVVLDKVMRPGTQLLGVASLALITAPVYLWALAWVLPYVPVFAFAAVLVWRHWHASPALEGPAVIDGRPAARTFWRFTAPRAVASGAQAALQRVDVLMVASLAGLVPAAAYAVAGRFIVMGQLANGAISQAVQPRLAELLSTNDHAGAARLYQTATAWLVLLSWPLHLLVFHYAELYLRFFGESYVFAAPAVRVLSGAMLVATGCGMVDIVLSMAGRTTWNLMNVLLALGTMVVIDILAIPVLGVLGAAIGLAAAVLVNNLLPLAQLGWSLGLHPFGSATLTAMALTLLSFLVVPWLVRAPIAGVCAGACVYALGLRICYRRLGLAIVLAARNRR